MVTEQLLTEVTFTLGNCFFKQIDGCTMRKPILVTISDIYMIKLTIEVNHRNKSIKISRRNHSRRRSLRYRSIPKGNQTPHSLVIKNT